MDHSYEFYIGLSYLQLNEFEKAEQLFKEESKEQAARGQPHHLGLFYFGIANYKGSGKKPSINLTEVWCCIHNFRMYSIPYYKAVSMARLGYREEAEALFKESETNREIEYTINECN